MGMSPRAHLAYGYDLGTLEDFKAVEVGEYGYPDLPWFDSDDEDEDGDGEDFGTAAERILLASVGFTDEWSAGDDGWWERKRAAEGRLGVEFVFSGGDEIPGHILAIKGSEQSVNWAETMTLDTFVLERTPIDEGWDDKLAAALEALGIHPTQTSPQWLVFPSYG